ncbi:MAG TPA: ATP-binding protein [Candidatus Nitrosotalea sp.]|nr:ATP-binding protein [Candidatus Nitrosotalea sp.]
MRRTGRLRAWSGPGCRRRGRTGAISALKERGQGSGFGLAIVRQLAELHGGTVSVASTPGQGSMFSVELPTAEPVA